MSGTIWNAKKGCYTPHLPDTAYTGPYNVYYDKEKCTITIMRGTLGANAPHLVLFKSNVQQCDLLKVQEEASWKCRTVRDPWLAQQAAGTPVTEAPAQAVNVQAAPLEDVPTQRPPLNMGLLALGAVGGLAILYLAL